ncbi:UNVERIFIED_CONTAM: hypothetical protein Slati_3522400 [Sesamum latifolium]|uniref:Uncharacterized protein n=1 Tax=Sesamum latifolium TaxID=2727402 RepID=A0AAW2UHP2_9LAMI
MGLEEKLIRPRETTLMGFEGSMIRAMGEIPLPISLGEEPYRKTHVTNFLVVDTKYPSYNIILGRPTLNTFKVVISISCLKIKFLTEWGIGEVRGDQYSARECRCHALKKIPEDEPTRSYGQHTGKVDPVNEIRSLSLSDTNICRAVQVGSNLNQEEVEQLRRFFQNKQEVFEWEEGGTTGIDEKVIQHELHVKKGARPVKQRKRNFGRERNQVIYEEIHRLLKLGYIREIYYPKWISNVVLVPKPGGKWRMCVDFTDLNNACPKDSYPLPRIDLLVDSTSGCERLSMLDAYQEYNQIKLAKGD